MFTIYIRPNKVCTIWVDFPMPHLYIESRCCRLRFPVNENFREKMQNFFRISQTFSRNFGFSLNKTFLHFFLRTDYEKMRNFSRNDFPHFAGNPTVDVKTSGKFKIGMTNGR